MTFSIEGDSPAENYFFVNPNTGVVTLLVSVDNLNINLFRVSTSAVVKPGMKFSSLETGK